MVTSGCVAKQKYQDLKVRNDTQRQRIAELDSELQTARLKLDQLERRLAGALRSGSVEADTLEQKIAALEEDLQKKKELIGSLQQQLVEGGMSLPVELSTKLEDFAKGQEMITFDAARGVVRFKSDLLFERGSANVASSARQSLQALCEILNSQQGREFDVIVAGHTDDMRIAKPATKAKHPTNWHLSAHRAISVLNVMAQSGIAQKRMSIRGFGEFRPVVPNKPNKEGNPKNRRVEIYIVPEGM